MKAYSRLHLSSYEEEEIRSVFNDTTFLLSKHYWDDNLLKYIKSMKSRKDWQCYLLLLLLFYYIGTINFGFGPQEIKFRNTVIIGKTICPIYSRKFKSSKLRDNTY